MNSKSLQTEPKAFASSFVSTSPISRNANLNSNLVTDVKFKSPLATVQGISSVKGVLEFWGALEGRDPEVKDASFDDKTSTLTIKSNHIYILPVVRLVQLSIPTVIRVHFVEEEGFNDPILVVDSIESTGGVGQLLKYGGLLTAMVPETLGPILAFAGTQHLRFFNQVAHSRRLIDTQRPPSLVDAALNPRRTFGIVLAWVFILSFSIVVWAWNRWNAFVDARVRPLKVSIGVTSTNPITNPAPISHPSSHKRPHSPQNSFIAASTSSAPPPSKQARIESSTSAEPPTPAAAKPENLQSNPVPGESYAAAVKVKSGPSSSPSGPNSLLPLPDLPEGTTSTTEQIDDPESPVIEKTTTNIPAVALDHLHLGDAVSSKSPAAPPITTTSATPAEELSTTAAATSTPPSKAAALPTPASELPPSFPPAPSTLNGIFTPPKAEASQLDDVVDMNTTEESQSSAKKEGAAPGVEVHSDVKGAFSYAKVAEKGEHAKVSEVAL